MTLICLILMIGFFVVLGLMSTIAPFDNKGKRS